MAVVWSIHKDDDATMANNPLRIDFVEYQGDASGNIQNVYLHELVRQMSRLSVYWDEMGHLRQIYRGRTEGVESGGTLVWHIHGDDGVPNGRVEFQVLAPGACVASSSSSVDCEGILVHENVNKHDEMGHWYESSNCVDVANLHLMPGGSGGVEVYGYIYPADIDDISSSGSSSGDCYPCVIRNRTLMQVRLQIDEEGHLRRVERIGEIVHRQVINTVCDSAGSVRDPCCVEDFGTSDYVNYTCRNLNVRMEFTCTASPPVLVEGAGIISYDDANGWWQGDLELGCVGTITLRLVCVATGVGECEYRRRLYADGVETTQPVSEGDAPSCCPVDFQGGWTAWTAHSCDCGIPPTPGIPGTLAAHVYECEVP